MKHFLVYNSNEAGDGFVGNPLFLMSFEDDAIPESFLGERNFLRRHASGRTGHNFVNCKPVTMASMERLAEKFENKAKDMAEFLRQAQAVEDLF